MGEVVGWMKNKPGENDYSMLFNENHNGREGGFLWEFIDFKPEEIENYLPIYINKNPTQSLLVEAVDLLEKFKHLALNGNIEFNADSVNLFKETKNFLQKYEGQKGK